MGMHTKYLICYDISSNKDRRKFVDFIKDLGLYSLQKSVFFGELNKAELNSLKRYVKKNISPESDKVFWMVARLSSDNLQEGVGYEGFEFLPADGYKTI